MGAVKLKVNQNDRLIPRLFRLAWLLRLKQRDLISTYVQGSLLSTRRGAEFSISSEVFVCQSSKTDGQGIEYRIPRDCITPNQKGRADSENGDNRFKKSIDTLSIIYSGTK